MRFILIVATLLLHAARGQLVGTEQTETHPGMTWQSCIAKGSCTTKNGKIVIDANWRWLHVKGGYVFKAALKLNSPDQSLVTTIATWGTSGTWLRAQTIRHAPLTALSMVQITKAPTVFLQVAIP